MTSDDRPVRPRRVVVTGGAGFVGSHIVEELIEAGCDILVVDDLSTGFFANVRPEATFVQSDICDPLVRQAILTFQPDAVIHAAARTSVPESLKHPEDFARVNALGSGIVGQMALEAGARRFIYLNTGGALYGNPRYLPLDEAHPIAPISPYGETKWSGEEKLVQLRPALAVTVLRLANVYGARQEETLEGAVVPTFIERMRRGAAIVIDGEGTQTRDFLAVEDVVRCVSLALQKPPGTFNVGSGTETSILDLFTMLARLTGYTREPEFGPERAGDVRRSVLSSRAAESALGWRPAVSLDDGLGKLVEAAGAAHI